MRKSLGKALRDESGVALMMVLMISAIALSVMASLLYMLSVGSQISGSTKRFTTALEAGKGGEAVVRALFATRGNPEQSFVTPIALMNTISETCIKDKFNKATSSWDRSCNASLEINISDPKTYDLRFDLSNYRVYAKIVNTVEGNTGPSSSTGLRKSGVVAANSGEVDVMKVSYIYTVEMDSRSITNPVERAKLSLLYQY